MREPDCVGALIRDHRNRVYVQRRSLARQQLPGAWDIVGGHVEPGETPLEALAREIAEETGWRLLRVESVIADWSWRHDGRERWERDYLVEVAGDLSEPRLELGKHDDFRWVGYQNPDSIRTRYDTGNEELWRIVRRATRVRLTNKLRLEPMSTASTDVQRWLDASGVTGLDGQAVRGGTEDKASASAATTGLGGLWDTGRGYDWFAYHRDAHESAVGCGGLVRRRLGGDHQLVLRCALPENGRSLNSAVDLVKAILAFARHELHAEQVVAYASPTNQWACETLEHAGMCHTGTAGRALEAFAIDFLEDHSYDLEQEVISGIGQILAVP